ncbi:pectate lyase superfamily protein-domain-containing protein [Phyllosticta capitalensis]|uniref:Pectate lyase superfamily protein-domain-containing protein n=1 Tax=Phyllosticta capitalensis TaxID=121624 RepID=A0ABR1YNF0_9PEZI
MISLGSLAITLAVHLLSLPAGAAPAPVADPQAGAVVSGLSSALSGVASAVSGGVNAAATAAVSSSSSYWVANIERQGQVAYGSSDYQIFRNVKDFGAVGDGSTDDTAAINKAISSGGRCGKGCDSTTVTPAIIYFPAGTYVVSKPIVQYYYTQIIGDATNLPVIKAAAGFTGMAVIDADPYEDNGANWYTNQNNFFRQIRNLVIDLTAMPSSSGAGIHWQVAQATSLQNIRFEMVKGGSSNKQQGIFMDNGSGGFMVDLTFNGGNIGAFLGSQQFTTRNLTFNDCNTAIFMNWNWGWTFKGVTVNNCGIGIDMANSPSNQTVGSVLVLDSVISATLGVNASFSKTGNVPVTGGSLWLDNVDFTGSKTAVVDQGQTVLAGGSHVSTWAQGRSYTGSKGTVVQGPVTVSKPAELLNGAGYVVAKEKPQYELTPASSFVSIKSKGAKGDGVTDDTAAIQSALDSLTADQILYFDHGAYVVTDTIKVPGTKTIRITGEIWPLIMAKGFSDQNNPKPVFQIGEAGDNGLVEISDLIFETLGPAPGAILMQWNVASQTKGAAGIWDVHFRIGGSAGTKLQSDTCAKNPNATHAANLDCVGAFMLFHATAESSPYVENSWFWVADHELDLSDHNQIDIYNGRGVLIESTKGAWLYGTSAEHSVLYNYQLVNASNVFMGLIQTETPYFQSNPDATTPFTSQSAWSDPSFTGNELAKKAWGLRIVDSSDVMVYGGGLYSFFENYSQDCLATQSCQTNMISLEGTNSNIILSTISTKAAVNMITVEGNGVVLDKDNRNNFCANIVQYSLS